MNTKNLKTLRDVKENLNLIETEGTRKFAEKIFSTPNLDLDINLDTYVTFDFVVKNIGLDKKVKEVDVIFNNSFSTEIFDMCSSYRDIFEKEMNYDKFINFLISLKCLFTLSDLNKEQKDILENAKTLAKYHLKDDCNNTLLYAKVLEKDNQNYLYVDILNSYQTYQTKRNYRSEVLIKIDEDDAKELMRLIEKDDNIKICKNISELIDGKRYFYKSFQRILQFIEN